MSIHFMTAKRQRSNSVDMTKLPGSARSVGDQIKNAMLGPVDTWVEEKLTTENEGPVDTEPERKKARKNAPEETQKLNEDSMDVDTQQPSL